MNAGHYVAYRWASAQIGGWGTDDLGKGLALQTKGDPPFYGVIMLAMQRADTMNLEKLRSVFPGIYEEAQARYHSPFALLKSDPDGLHRKAMGAHYSAEAVAELGEVEAAA